MFSFDESTEISARFHRKVLRKDFFTKITFRKRVHSDFYGYLDVNFVVSVFYPNKRKFGIKIFLALFSIPYIYLSSKLCVLIASRVV